MGCRKAKGKSRPNDGRSFRWWAAHRKPLRPKTIHCGRAERARDGYGAAVVPFFQKSEKPDFVVNVPSKAIWSGPAIDLVHNLPAAFGGMGDLGRAARLDDVSSYRFRNYEFVETGIRQHSAVSQVERLFDRKFLAHRWDGPDFTIALVDTYMMSAEDIRHVRDRYGTFDVALKMTSYGGITSAAHDAAASMGAEACMWGDLMRRLARN